MSDQPTDEPEMPRTAGPDTLRVASMEILQANISEATHDEPRFEARLVVRAKDQQEHVHVVSSSTEQDVTISLVSKLCIKPIEFWSIQFEEHNGHPQTVVAIQERRSPDTEKTTCNTAIRRGVGRYVSDSSHSGLLVATIRAVSHAGLLKSNFRANNQKVFREWSRELTNELVQVLEADNVDNLTRLEAESISLEYMNRVASAAVVTAANHPKPDTILSLFDTSAWLFDRQGLRRDSYTETSLWLAWYPGINNDRLTVEQVIDSMPQAPPSKIPWIVKLFENPDSWIRFRGAVNLEDHDVMHVLLGRGLQDQDEAFVIGFAMGTAKRVSFWQYWIFKFVIARLYPEPYRIPKFLQPAFNLGVRCGQETGSKDLYKQHLSQLRGLTLAEARQWAGIDMSIVRKYFELEQQQIPFTIASLRLP